MGAKTKRANVRIRRRPPASGRKPSRQLPSQDVEGSAQELITFHHLFEACFQRQEQRQWSLFYLCGQLSNLVRKTIEPMVVELLGVKGKSVRGVQRFISENTWSWEAVITRCQELVASWLGEPDGVVIADGSGFPKQGDHSVGAARQYCGHLGKIANCQQGVFLAYASSRGHAFLDERLYVPESWFDAAHHQHRQACGLPEEVSFQTEPQLALAMLAALVQRDQVPFRWVTVDAGYGKSPVFLDGIARLGKWYLAEVPSDLRVWRRTPTVQAPGLGLLGRPRTQPRVALNTPSPSEMQQLAARLPKSAWLRYTVMEGSKGPVVAQFAVLRVTQLRDGLPGSRVWALLRRTLGANPEYKYFLSNAPTTCTLHELIRVSSMRWPIETALEEGKGEVGMDHYETRTWQGWHHHMTQSMLAHLFLMRLCLIWEKKSSVHRRAGSSTRCSSHRRTSPSRPRRVSHPALSPASQSCRLSFASQAGCQATAQEALCLA